MNINRFTLETYSEKMTFANKQRKSIEVCPFCGSGNKDGKFVPYTGFKDRGHCFSCGKSSPMGKHVCPDCHSVNSFNRYIDTENSNQYLSDEVGKCLYCNYHYPPKQYFEDAKNGTPPAKQYTTPPERIRQAPPKPEPSFIDAELFKQSLAGYKANNFVTFLISLFGEEIAGQLIAKYFIGSSKHWPGSTIFWQIDTKGMIRTGKVMLYNAISGHRIKEPISCVTWVQSVLKLPDFNMTQCLFGQHLLTDKTKPVAIVESEKTAIIASVYLPQFIWLAVGGKDGLNLEKCSVLKGRKVFLYPDLKCFEKWSFKAKDFNSQMIGTRFSVSDLLERNATEQERNDGLDIADYLIKFDHRQFEKVTKLPSFKTLVQAAEYEAINWFNGHLLQSMQLSDISFCDSLNFDSG